MTPTEQNEALPPAANGWRFEKRLSLDTLIAIVGVAVVIGGPMFVWARGMENRIQSLETMREQELKYNTQRQVESREQQKEFLERMDKFSEQVTQLRITLGGPQARK